MGLALTSHMLAHITVLIGRPFQYACVDELLFMIGPNRC